MRTMILKVILYCLLLSCTNIDRDKQVDRSDLIGADYRLFQNTPAWNLAKAVQDEDEKRINEILAKEPKLINYQEPKYGNTLLMLTVMNQQIKPFKVLLDNKADVNIHNTYYGTSALIEACSFKQYDPKFAEVLIQNGANVNDIEVGERRSGNSTRFTPLIAAAKTGKLALVELLVKNGAYINYQNEYKQSALSQAVKLERYEVILFLLHNGADYKLPITYSQEQNRTYYLVDELRFYMPEIGSKEYKYKMQIVDFLKSKGIDYRATSIPEYIKKKAQEEYPDSWQEYLERY